MHITPLITTIAVAFVLQEGAVKLFGSEQRSFPIRMFDQLKTHDLQLGAFRITAVQMFIIGASLVLMVGLYLFVEKTKMGMAMRACAENTLTARLLGVNVHWITVWTFGIASALAGAAGVLIGLAYNITPLMGGILGLKGLTIMLFGGSGNIVGAMVAALILGMIETMSVAYLVPAWKDGFAFGILILILLYKPRGCSAVACRSKRGGRGRGHASGDRFSRGHRHRPVHPRGGGSGHHRDQHDHGAEHVPPHDGRAVVLWASRVHVHRGAYRRGADPLCGRAVPGRSPRGRGGHGLVGFLVGVPVLRLRGLLLALVTFAFAQVVEVFFLNFKPTGAAEGIRGIFPYTTLWYVYGFLALLVIFLARLRHSRMGRAFEAVKLDETAAEAMGVNVTRAKLMAFSSGAFVAGVGGALYAHHAVFIQYDNFDFRRGVDIAMYMVLGGMDVFYGPLLGAFIITYLSTALQFLADWRWEVWGSIVILVMIFRPQGILGRDTLNVRRWFRPGPAPAA